MDENGECVCDEVIEPPVLVCPETQIVVGDSCVCPEGEHMDENGRCVCPVVVIVTPPAPPAPPAPPVDPAPVVPAPVVPAPVQPPVKDELAYTGVTIPIFGMEIPLDLALWLAIAALGLGILVLFLLRRASRRSQAEEAAESSSPEADFFASDSEDTSFTPVAAPLARKRRYVLKGRQVFRA
jgi:hypothetical protein